MASSRNPSEERDPARRARILEAAVVLFARYGLRRTSMDAIAGEARVAKPTLYAYFENKETLFIAVCEEIVAGILDAARAAAEGQGDLDARLGAVLAAKFTRVFELVHASPHAAELLSSQERHAAEIVARADRAYRALLLRMLEDALERGEISLATAGVEISEVVDVLLRSAHGASWQTTTASAHRRNLRQLVRVVLAGLRPGA